jgi:hypothetical protein
MAKKTTCPITRAQFRADARPVEVTIAGTTMTVPVKEFSTGSLGWYLNGKTTINVGGQTVPVQIGLNLTIVGSKELPQDAPPSAPAPASGGEAASA